MMKYLTLVRHAKSCWKNPLLKDHQRPLNRRGAEDAPRVGRHIAEQISQGMLPSVDLILHSDALRTCATAKLLANELGLLPQQLLASPALYECNGETLLNHIRLTQNSIQHLLVVGHNPGLMECYEELSDFRRDKFPTGAVLHLALPLLEDWQQLQSGQAEVRQFIRPKSLP
ncbi:SixA phosphatase family protein [Balneatrix alpica]|uniref:Histidine phosphatase family protein n=1 Tax=Balneatrix alpica TaxID=75684 RepID=A0ABV5ZCP9_9GAMM|nr:histidine phosphatase family protein [Balneatrix alpica]